MSNKIKLRRSIATFDELKEQEISFGEPIFIDGTEGYPVTEDNEKESYLVIGRKPKSEDDVVEIGNSPVIKVLSKNKADRLVFKSANGISDSKNNPITVEDLRVKGLSILDLNTSGNTKYHVLFQAEGSEKVSKFDLLEKGIYATSNGVIHGAAWNDYAENRKIIGPAKPGQVVCDFEDGVVLSDERLQPCAYVVSDTYGYTMGADEPFTVPVAVAGRVLTYVKDKNPKVGDVVCADKDGFASVMTREEIVNYPDRILGVVSEIPRYKMWQDRVPVDGRVWIKIK